ncbi:helix-turn-helix domain-containing protein [Actinomadura craniellae]|uniref:helix-turn-helix domain-containing protein n=1 Tax=Actinomadura craniellae TaxID=2231787 RepID=UPI0018F23C4B|nr:helix-turn-helix transcriptional regulator [Actinomadura craniellae]
MANELRRLRESVDMTCEEVAARLECSPSKISRMETGRVRIHPRDVRDLLAVYEVDGRHMDHLVAIAREARERSWWNSYDGVLSKDYLTYIGLEAAATRLCTYEAQIMPGLLQTEEYARALMDRDPYARDVHAAEQFVAARLERQRILTSEEPVEFSAILDESVIRRVAGGRQGMLHQVEHLLETMRLPNVEVRVLPFSYGAHHAVAGAFALLEFPDPADPDIVCIEHLLGGICFESEHEIGLYRQVFDHIHAASLSPDDSFALIARVADELR